MATSDPVTTAEERARLRAESEYAKRARFTIFAQTVAEDVPALLDDLAAADAQVAALMAERDRARATLVATAESEELAVRRGDWAGEEIARLDVDKAALEARVAELEATIERVRAKLTDEYYCGGDPSYVLNLLDGGEQE